MAEIQTLADELKEVLNKVGVRYSADNIKWALTSDEAELTNAINDKSGSNAQLRNSHIIFLEQGNSNAGLKHIYLRHADDFKKKDYLDSEEEVSNYIESTMKEYAPFEVTSGKRGGLDVVYKIKDDNYLHVTIGSNGFIVTAFPSSKP